MPPSAAAGCVMELYDNHKNDDEKENEKNKEEEERKRRNEV